MFGKHRSVAGGFAAAVALMISVTPAVADDGQWFPYPVEVWNPPFDMESPRTAMTYVPVEQADKAWNICVSVPHMKDPYWLAVDYGVVSEARRSGVKLSVFEAGGYTNLSRQISQIEDCVANGADAVIVGAISFDGLNNLIGEIVAGGVPVIDFMNGVSSTAISATSKVSFGEMGESVGRYLAEKHPAGSGKVQVAWFPGPAGAGWVEAGNVGFVEAVKGSDVEVVDTKYGDTGKEAQLKLVEDILESRDDLDYIVGTAPTTEAAYQALRSRGLQGDIMVLSYYMTPSVFAGLKSGDLEAAPTDSTVIQGRIAVDLAVRILEDEDYVKHVGPELTIVRASDIDGFDPTSSLAPDGFTPVFTVD